MATSFPEVISTPVLSTAHLTRLDHDLLEAAIDIDRYTKHEDATWSTDWTCPLIVLEDNQYGYWIYCAHEGLDPDDPYIEDEIAEAGFSPSLIDLLKAGKEGGHTYIRFDRDGFTHQAYPTFDWSEIRKSNVDVLEKQLRALAWVSGRATPKSTELTTTHQKRQALLAGLILGLIPRLDANADEILQAAQIVGLPWSYKDTPRLFVIASKADLIPDDSFFVYNPDTGEFVEEHADGKGTA